MPDPVQAEQIDELRRFTRFYTRCIGALEEGLLGSPFPLTQARVLFELRASGVSTAGDIRETLGLDLGYLSRILQGFAAQGLIDRKKADDDARRVLLSLTAKGRRAADQLDRTSREQVGAMLARFPAARRARLLAALRDAQAILSDADDGPVGNPVSIRPARVGDLGWAIERHGTLYAQEYGLNEAFEALVATLFARFASAHDPACERFWVAELGGERVGCVFVVRQAEDPTMAQLRCLLVDPAGRGAGVGRLLVAECIAFARAAGYRGIMLWTNDVLVSARRIYEAAGFVLFKEERHHSFGRDLVGQFWQLVF